MMMMMMLADNKKCCPTLFVQPSTSSSPNNASKQTNNQHIILCFVCVLSSPNSAHFSVFMLHYYSFSFSFLFKHKNKQKKQLTYTCVRLQRLFFSSFSALFNHPQIRLKKKSFEIQGRLLSGPE